MPAQWLRNRAAVRSATSGNGPKAPSRPTPDSLRPRVRFHDGTPFTSADVAASLNRILNPATGAVARSNIADIQSISTPAARTVVLHLADPDVPVLAALADLSGVGRSLIPEISGALRAQGLLGEEEHAFESVDQLLDGLEKSSGRLAEAARLVTEAAQAGEAVSVTRACRDSLRLMSSAVKVRGTRCAATSRVTYPDSLPMSTALGQTRVATTHGAGIAFPGRIRP